MDPKFQTSFIPKRPIVASGMTVSRKSPLNWVSIIAFILFILAALASVGAFLYEKKLIADNKTKQNQIETEIKAFDPALTAQLSTLKTRIDSATDILKRHTALSAFFDLLGKNTVSSIQFKDFAFTGDYGKALAIKMKGEAKSFNDVIFQSDTFLANENMKNVIFSGFSLDDAGNVSFSIDAEINPDYVSYKKNIEKLSVSVPVDPITSTSSASTAVATSTATTTTTNTTP